MPLSSPLAVVVRMDPPGAADLCAHVRTQACLADVPVFGVAAERSDIAFTELFSWGGDDLVSLWWPQSAPEVYTRAITRPEMRQNRAASATLTTTSPLVNPHQSPCAPRCSAKPSVSATGKPMNQ